MTECVQSDIVLLEPCWTLCWPELHWCNGDEAASDQCLSVLGMKGAMCPREKGCLCPSAMQLWDLGTHPCPPLHILLVLPLWPKHCKLWNYFPRTLHWRSGHCCNLVSLLKIFISHWQNSHCYEVLQMILERTKERPERKGHVSTCGSLAF